MDILNIIPDQAVNARQSSAQPEPEQGPDFESFLADAREGGELEAAETSQPEEHQADADAQDTPVEAEPAAGEAANLPESESDTVSEAGESFAAEAVSEAEQATGADSDDVQEQTETPAPVIIDETVDLALLDQVNTEGEDQVSAEEEDHVSAENSDLAESVPVETVAEGANISVTEQVGINDGDGTPDVQKAETRERAEVSETKDVNTKIVGPRADQRPVEAAAVENAAVQGRDDKEEPEQQEALAVPGKFAGIFRRRTGVHSALRNSNQSSEQPGKIESFLEEIFGKKLADEIKTYIDIARLTDKDSAQIQGVSSVARSKPALEHSNADENRWYWDGLPGNSTGAGPDGELNGIERGKFSDTLANIMRRPNIAMHVIRQIAPVAASLLSDGRTEFSISLNPPQLGHVKLAVVSDGQSLMARIQVDSDGLKDALERSLDDLRRSLQDQGVEIEGFEVSVNSGSDDLFSDGSGDSNDEDMTDEGADEAGDAQDEAGVELIGDEGILNILA